MLDYPPRLICCCGIHFKSVMKTTLFLSSLLTACATCVAQADELTVAKTETKTIDGDLITNRLTINGANSPTGKGGSLIVKGKTIIEAN